MTTFSAISLFDLAVITTLVLVIVLTKYLDDLTERSQNLMKALLASTAKNDALHKEIKELKSDPAIHFANRFAVVLECMLVADTSSPCWDEAVTLLSEYGEAQDKWREAMGEPYVSGFGKD